MQRTTASILAEYPQRKKELLIHILQEIQEVNGYLSVASIGEVSKHINLPVSRIYGVAAFYDQFRLTPRGEYHLQVCRGTNCHLKDSAALLKEIEKTLRVRQGTVRRDGKISLEVVTCLGACSHGPVIRINGEYHKAADPQRISEILQSLKETK